MCPVTLYNKLTLFDSELKIRLRRMELEVPVSTVFGITLGHCLKALKVIRQTLSLRNIFSTE